MRALRVLELFKIPTQFSIDPEKMPLAQAGYGSGIRSRWIWDLERIRRCEDHLIPVVQVCSDSFHPDTERGSLEGGE